jgi:hypothetical protein
VDDGPGVGQSSRHPRLQYLDDFIVVSKSLVQHEKDVEEVFRRLRSAGLVINGEKCEFAVREVQFLGHHFTAEGLRPLPDRVAAIQDHPRPSTVKLLQAFLGVVNFYRRFVPATRQLTYAEVAPEPAGAFMEASHVYIRHGGAIPPLAPLYTGPYKVLARQAKFFKLEIGCSQETVSVDHLKPHLGLAPVVLAAPPVHGRPPAAGLGSRL